jgi:cytochrome c peroxidase
MQGRRHSPSLYGVAYLNRFFWDGRAHSLERQALDPVSDPREMASSWEDVLHYLSTGEHRGTGVRYPEAARYYRDTFDQAFQGTVSAETVASALAAYQRTLLSTGSAFDRWLAGDDGALSAAQIQGALIFFGRARCGECHPPPAFTDSQFHNVGVPRAGHESSELFPVNARICGGVPDHVDPGRAGTGDPVSCDDLGAFRTPSLRNVELSPPYMHNGVFPSLESVVLHYWNVGRGTTNTTAGELDRRMRLIRLTDSGGHPDDIRNLVEFLKGLTGSTRSGPPGGISPPGGTPGSVSPTSPISRPAPGRLGS